MKNLTLTASILATATACAGASASVVDVQYNGVGYNQVVTVTSPGYSGGVHAGQLLITATNSSDTNAFANGNYTVFCGDLFQFTSGGPNQYSVVGVAQVPDSAPMGAAKAAAIGDLYAFANGAQFGTDADYACAFQLAIWETVFDFGGGLSTANGLFQASGYSSATGTYLAGLLGSIGTTGGASLVGLQSPAYQDFIVQVPGPGSLALLGFGGLVGMRRRRA